MKRLLRFNLSHILISSNYLTTTVIVLALYSTSCNNVSIQKTRLIFDTDANNEPDDQHALAYLLFNGNEVRLNWLVHIHNFN